MGVVYEVREAEDGTPLALKQLPRLSPDALLRFKNEFRVLQGLSHPNLVTLGELMEDAGEWFFTMELVEGRDFLSYVRRGSDKPSTPSELSTAPRTEDLTEPLSGGAREETTRAMTIAPRGQKGIAAPGPSRLPAAFDEARLRACLLQLADALNALHDADKLHCDLKPANILVTEQGRVVLLDFGLATEIGRRVTHDRAGTQTIGTPSYMSPEHAAGRGLTRATDWYSFGVLLYEALTGTRPFSGSSTEILVLKQRLRPLEVREIVPEAPADLAQLCDDLLNLQPERRPTGPQVSSRLSRSAAADALPLIRDARFVGRRGELARLRQIYEKVEAGGSAAVVIEGPSGIGKSSLVRAWLQQLAQRGSRALVLHGRCYEREAVPYKAYDAAMDELSQRLLEEPLSALPAAARVLAQAFPVLKQVPVFESGGAEVLSADRSDLRDRLFSGLRALLTSIGRSRPIVLQLDDAQWSDADSLALTEALVRAPMPAGLMLIATVRAPAEACVQAAFGEGATRIALEDLSAEDAHALARELLPGCGAALAAEIAHESAGHPLFIEELGRHLASHPEAGASGLQLDVAIGARVAELDPGDRRLLELLSVHAAPLRHDVLSAAADFSFAEYDQRAQRLQALHFVRGTGARRTDVVALFHDRIRETVHATLDPVVTSQRHRALAVALHRSAPEGHEALAMHWQGAGDSRQAAHHALLGAAQAREVFAYDREAKLLRTALELLPHDRPHECALRHRLAQALVRSGRAAEAGREYMSVAALAGADEAVEFERLAAECLLRSGHVEEGTSLLRRVVATNGLKVPQTPGATIASLLWSRLRLKLRGLKYRERTERDIAPRALRRIDTCWSAATGLVLIDTVTAWAIQAQGILLALDAGEPHRVGRAFALEIAQGAHFGGRPLEASEALAAKVHALAARLDDPYLAGMAHGMLGVAAFERGLFGRAIRDLESAERILTERCAGSDFEVTSIRYFANRARAMTGDWVELARCVPEYVRQAVLREDRLTAAMLSTGYLNFAWLAVDQPHEARRAVHEGMKHWSRQGTHIEHDLALFAEIHVDLYEGAFAEAHRRMEEAWPRIEGSSLMRVESFRNLMLHHRAVCLATAPVGLEPAFRRRVIKDIARRLARSKAKGFRARSLLLRAIGAHQDGDSTSARHLLEESAQMFAGAEMRIYEWAVRWRIAQWEGGSDGAARLKALEHKMRTAGAINPPAVVRMLAPALDLEASGPVPSSLRGG